MTEKKFAAQAAAECASEKTSVRQGGEGKPFWNSCSIQFMYAPAFQFHSLPGIKKYRYNAVDEYGKIHSFEADHASAGLFPIWAEIPEGVVNLTVYALDENENEKYPVGSRTFFRLSPFPSDLPDAACSYREAAARAFDYAMSQSFIRHWLTEGTPDPDYDLNVYPSKMISSVIDAMLYYAKVRPDQAKDALKIAENCADYLIGITAKDGPMKNVPPTYQLDFRPNPETRQNLSAEARINWVMMIYPAQAGTSYLNLEAETGEKRYLEEALKIGEHYRASVQENGSWFLIRDIRTGEVFAPNYCEPLEQIVPFLMALYRRTGEEVWRTLSENAIAFVENNQMETYEWGGQFEDSFCSSNYSNLTHYGAAALTRYYAEFFPDDPVRMEKADELMRFVEDQFVVWKRPSPWNKNCYDTSRYHTPCGFEQYLWYVPIDASTSNIISTFLAMYKAGRGELHLEKAKALADSITRVQQENGLIPTHWMTPEHIKGENFWINCMFAAACTLAKLSDLLEK